MFHKEKAMRAPTIAFMMIMIATTSIVPVGSQTPKGKIVAMIGGDTAAYTEIINRFTAKYPGTSVELLPAPATSAIRREKYVTMFAAKDKSMDVLLTNCIDTSEFASAGWTMPLDNVIDMKILRDTYYPANIDSGTWNGKLYALPHTADALHLYYRKDLLDQAGLAPPTTWDDLVKISEKLKGVVPYGLVSSWEKGNQFMCQFLLYAAGNGGSILSKDGNTVTLDSPENEKALQLMTDMIHKYGIAPLDNLSLTVDDGRIIFNQGKAIFNVNWDYAWGQYQSANSVVKDKVGMAPMPVFPGKAPSSVLGGWGLSVNNYSANKATAVAFISFLSDTESIRYLLKNTSQSFSNKKIMSEPAYLSFNSVFTGALSRDYGTTVSRPVTPRLAEIVDAFNQYLMPAVYNKATVKDSLKSAANRIKTVITD